MNAYVDTGVLCSLYAPDAHSVRAAACMARQSQPLPFTWLHRVEFRNALRLRVFRKEISAAERDIALNTLLTDMAAGIYRTAEPEMSSLTTEAERLSAQHSETLGTRSLDILHVASALVLGLPEFLTLDQRQAALAKAAGLRVPRL